MGRKQEYKETNLEFLKEFSSQEGVYALPCGIYYKVLETGTGTVFPNVRSIVTVHYKGSLINGRVFDNSYERNCPEAFRLCDVIDGWQLALHTICYRAYCMRCVISPPIWDGSIICPIITALR